MRPTSQPHREARTATPRRFGELLREHRLSAGLTQESLAEQAGLVHGVQKLEQGATQPYRDTAQRLASALQLSGVAESVFKSAAQPMPRRRRAPTLVPVITSQQIHHNLPLPTTSFFDDAGQLAAVTDRLRTNRLVTITGSAGCGKTRLAVEVALQLVSEFADGLWFVDLAPVAEDSHVSAAIAKAVAVGKSSVSTQSTLDAVTQYLQTRQVLLILDNCEHLVDACAHVADALLKACPGVRLMATSRELLQIVGEASWRVRSLSVVAIETDTGSDRAATADDVQASEAGRLFVYRAQLLVPAFTLTSEEAGAVAQIVGGSTAFRSR